MRLLSIFFVAPVARSKPFGSEKRLPGGTYKVDSEKVVDDFLDRCGLSTSDPKPGVFVRHHHQAFDVLAALCGRDEQSVSLTHVDAHSDLGHGDGGYVYIATELAHMPRSVRRNPRRSNSSGDLNEANWLAFAVAAGWVSDVTFVPRTMPTGEHDDLFRWHLNHSRDQIVIRKATVEEQKSMPFRSSAVTALDRLPIVETATLDIQDRANFVTTSPPDFVVICQSPQYTPKASDRVLRQCRARIKMEPLQNALEAPLGWSP